MWLYSCFGTVDSKEKQAALYSVGHCKILAKKDGRRAGKKGVRGWHPRQCYQKVRIQGLNYLEGE